MTDGRSVRIGGSVLIKWNRTLAESVLPSMSQPLLVIGAQSLLSFIAFGLIARWYVVPWLSKLSLEDRLLALIWPHVFRYVALTGFLAGQVSPDVPAHALDPVVYGDTISALLALLAVVMLRLRALGAIAMVWIFNIVGFLDWAQSQVVGMSAQAFSYPAGASAIVYAFYVPLLVVTHVVMLYWLFTHRRRGAPRLEGLSLKQRVEG